MRYLGGKARIAKHLVAALPDADRVWEPFCGGLNMTLELAKRYPAVVATDLHPGPIALGLALQAGWEPPIEVSEADHQGARNLSDWDPLKAFIGFGCSFAGDYFSGFTPEKIRPDNSHRSGPSGQLCESPAKAAAAFCKRIRPHLARIAFMHMSFLTREPIGGFLIYCDPPYGGTTGYTTGGFDHDRFWDCCAGHVRAGSRVFVSEYSDPPIPARLVWSKERRQMMRSSGGQAVKTEKLFEITL